MRKIKALACVLLSMILLCSCGGYNESAYDTEGNDGRMVVIYNNGHVIIYADSETGCQYFSRGGCGTCLMVDENGDPLLYDFGEE